jgi:putative spermidine/putrescine transport system substrate-binding protein
MRINHVLATLPALLAPFTALSAETLYVMGTGGVKQKGYEEQVIPQFEARTGAKVVYVPGSSTDIVAKLIAQKGKQDASVIFIDSGPIRAAMDQDLCALLPASPVMKDLYPSARLPGNTAVGVGFYATGLAYNKDVFAKNGWPAPTSWNDLGDPKYKGKVSIGPISGFGVEALVMLARANGGSEKNIEPGFQVMAKKVAPNVVAWEAAPANVGRMLQSGEAPLVVWSTSRTQPVIDQGAPVAFVFPKEGALQAISAACVVKGGPQQKLAQAFLEEVLSPEAQARFTKVTGYGPVNSKVKLDPESARKVIYGQQQVDSLVPVDWNVINKQRAEWTKRWNREVER